MRAIYGIIFLISLTCLPFHVLEAQSEVPVDNFLDRITNEYPNYNLVYLNDNVEISSFTLTERHLIICDISNGRSINGKPIPKGVYVYLLDKETRIISDTLFLKDALSIDKLDLFYNGEKGYLYFRPETGRIPGSESFFFKDLSFKVKIGNNQFEYIEVIKDSEELLNEYFEYLNPKLFSFNVSHKEKRASLVLNGKVARTYTFKRMKELGISAKGITSNSIFSRAITRDGLIIFDAIGEQLIYNNNGRKDKVVRSIELPDEAKKTLKDEEFRRFNLLYDDKFDQLYLRVSISSSEEKKDLLYRLIENRFVKVELKLPDPYRSSMNGRFGGYRFMLIIESKLYLVLNYIENGRSLDCIFYTII